MDPKSFAVLGPNGSFRSNSFDGGFNPTKTRTPFFQVFDNAFLDILGTNSSINEIAVNNTFAFAHEAPVFDPSTQLVYFGSNNGGALGNSDIDHNNKIFSLSLTQAEAALKAAGGGNASVNVPITEVLD